MKIFTISLLALVALPVSAVPLAINNADFENGLGDGATISSGLAVGAFSALSSWNQYANSAPGVTTEQSSTRSINGQYSAHIVGDTNNGLFQYQSAGSGIYTASAWFYAVTGSAYLGLFYNSGNIGQFSASTTATGAWQYLTNTFTLQSGLKGPVLYTAEDNSEFFVDGFSINAGSTSLSQWDPSTGFNPNNIAVPEPTTLIMMITGLFALVGMRIKA